MRGRLLCTLDEERGSLPLAMLAVIIVGGTVGVLLAATLAGGRATRFDRSFTSVIQQADAGVQEAANQIIRDPATAKAQPVGATYSGSGTGYTWTATKTSALAWTVESTGTTPDGIEREVETVVEDLPRFFLAAFADKGLRFNGGNGADSYGSSAWYTGNGVVGSNESIEIKGNTRVDAVHLYNWDDYPDLSRCNDDGGVDDCADVQAMPDAILPSRRIGPRLVIGDDLETAFIDEELADCASPLTSWTASDNGGVLGSPTTPNPQKLCYENMTFDQNTTLAPGADVEIYVRGSISVGNGVDVNCTSCNTGSSTPQSTRLQLYSTGSAVSFGNHSKTAAAIYAPMSECSGNPSNAQGEIFGSLICQTITNQGGWNFHYDDRLKETGTGEYVMTDWREEG